MQGEGPGRRQDRLRRSVTASLIGVSAVFVGLSLCATPANALCAPDPATSGQTVTCSGTDTDGFQAGAGVDSLNVNVLSGATVNDNGTLSIGVNNSSTVTNNGTLSAGSGLTGIAAGNTNTVTNNGTITVLDNGLGIQVIDHNIVANAGTITTGDNGAAISVGDSNTVTNTGALSIGASGVGVFAGQINSTNTITNTATGTITGVDDSIGIFAFGSVTVTNAGAITVGDSSGFSGGILAISNNNTITNTATGRIAVGQNAAGIFMQGDFQTASNFGSITAGDLGVGIAVLGDDSKIINGGTITVGDNGTAGISIQGDRATISQSGTITVGQVGWGILYNGSSSTITNSGRITGGDSTEGIFAVGDSNTITNSGTITVGTFGIGIDVSSFSTTNQIVNTGTITVGASGVGISVGGAGSVFNSGTINAATGLAAIEFCSCGPNTLTLGPGSAINGQVIASGTDTFQLGGTGKDTFNLDLIGTGLQYSGFSTFNKVDSSTWTVTGTGNQDWNVLGGTLLLAGTINGTVTVASGGTLSGVGTVGTTTVNGGTLAPGNPTGTLTVSGDLSFTSASSYMVQVSGASNGLAVVTGTATLGGATVVVVPTGSIAKHYTILNATTLPDAFNPVVAGLSSNLHATLSYDLHNVYLDLALGYGGGLNINQQNVANVLTNYFNSTGSLPVALANLSPAGLTQASGESGTGSQQTTFNAMNLFINLLTDVFGSGRSGAPDATPFADEASAYAAAGKGTREKNARDAFASIYRKAPAATFAQRWDVWAAGYGGSQTTDGNTALGSNTTGSSVYGTAVGLDYRFSPSTIAGFALAGGGTGFNVNGLGWGRSDLFQAGAFVRHTVGPAYITAALAYGWQDVTTNRIVTAAGVDQLRAQFNANAFSGRIEGGYRYATQWIGLTPYAAAQATLFSLPNYSEFAVVGNNTFALNYAAKDVTSTRTELGLRADKSFAAAGGLMTLRGRLAWAHDYNPDRTIGAVFQTLPGAAFVVNGAPQARDSALTTASVQMNWMNGWSASATFEGEFSNVTRSYAGKGVVRYAW
ncbi:autotransporter domain-containing protein [Bradyrhizobium huanghuaihaiense]|uniref:autotransporter outer membrane beta-barrel domain-containing protein n=1 Tax=Bradyrhizobium huanghuaihaiense TaxID=990078 RepID=UPI0021AA6C1B|nr:autotransporter outer membrane beta-barrel domain-containing protein [Bradyrhizobium sp. CB3035]UWU76758.1 autotransporter domain-containing protein [Bradyrhizobium sp. CB3035]